MASTIVPKQIPKQVSPLIRGLRWTFFIAGIPYGYKRLNSLTAKEKVFNEENKKRLAKRAERVQKERVDINRRSQNELAEAVNVSNRV